jgi:hypothetical protein
MISLFIFVQKGIRLVVGYKDLNEDYNVMQVALMYGKMYLII